MLNYQRVYKPMDIQWISAVWRLPPAGLMATSRRCRLQAGGLRELMIMKHVCCHIETKHIAGTWGLMLRNVLTLMLKVEVS